MIITLPQRNDLLLRVQVIDPSSAPVDLTGCDVEFRAGFLGRTVIEKSLGDGIEIEDASDGRMAIGITHEDTDLAPRVYEIELMLIDVEGARYTAASGRMTITKSIMGSDTE